MNTIMSMARPLACTSSRVPPGSDVTSCWLQSQNINSIFYPFFLALSLVNTNIEWASCPCAFISLPYSLSLSLPHPSLPFSLPLSLPHPHSLPPPLLLPLTDDIQLKHCSHALALYYVAGEEGAASASTTGKGLIAPGTLRQLFIDALNYLDDRSVQQKAEMFAFSEGAKKQKYH